MAERTAKPPNDNGPDTDKGMVYGSTCKIENSPENSHKVSGGATKEDIHTVGDEIHYKASAKDKNKDGKGTKKVHTRAAIVANIGSAHHPHYDGLRKEDTTSDHTKGHKGVP